MLKPIAYRRFCFGVSAMLSLMAFSGCEKTLGLKDPALDAPSVYEEAWTVMDQRYALFGIKGVDWKSVHDQYKASVTAGITKQELFRVIDNMLETLADGHVTLMSSFDTATYLGFYELYAKNFNYSNLLNNYLRNDYATIGPIIYKIQDSVGYFYYGSFAAEISDADVNKLFQAMQDTKGLIVDVRNNTGGDPANAERIFRHFLPDKALVRYEAWKSGTAHDALADPSPVYLSPAAPVYRKPVCVLTNRSCYSTCNDFVSYLSGLANVTIVGDQTGGGGSTPESYVMGNGWRLQYSASMTLSADKKPIEGGILPDVAASITWLDEGTGKDPILEAAYGLLQ